LEGFPGFEKPFEDAKAALSRLAQNGERFLRASVVVLPRRLATLCHSVLRQFVAGMGRAKQRLEAFQSAIPMPEPPAAAAEDLESTDAAQQ
jgi:hypothetical protein